MANTQNKLVAELRLGPTQSEFDRTLAFEEIQRKLNDMIRLLNELATKLEV